MANKKKASTMSKKQVGRKHIWMINHYAITPDMPGGTRHYDFATELTKRGYRVSIFASDFHYTLRKRLRLKAIQLKGIEIIDSVRFVWINTLTYKKFNFRRLLNLFSFTFNVLIVGLREEKPDVIIGSSPHIFQALAGWFLSRIKGSRFFFEIRDMWSQGLTDLGMTGWQSLFPMVVRWIEHFLYQRAEYLITLAPGAKAFLEKDGANSSKIVFIPNGVHLENFLLSKERESVRATYEFGNYFVIMYTGAHGPANSLHTVLEAAEVLREREEFLFVLVGDGPLKENLKQIANDKKLTNVRFLDPVPKMEIPNILHAADVGVITLQDIETYKFGVSPNKLFDYMAAELPVVCAIGGDMEALVKEANAGITVPPEIPKLLAEAIVKLHADPNLCKKLGRNGRKYIEKNMAREILVERLIERIQEFP